MRPLPRAAAALAAIAPVVVLTLATACGTDAVGVEACRKVESARCAQASSCSLNLSMPVHRDSDVDACVRFYHDACLHGLVVTNDPGSVNVDACVADIQSGNCGWVVHPETAPHCAWLVPPPPAPTATTPPADAGQSDAADAAGG